MNVFVKCCLIFTLFSFGFFSPIFAQTADEILSKIDENMSSINRKVESEMVIHGRRKSRTVRSISFSEGDQKSLTEYVSPAREKGTKMLKLEDRLWIYAPSSDRIIQISGHMLKQSVMGSDLSYEDMMDDRKLTDIYDASVVGEDIYDERPCWVLDLMANVDDVSYHQRKVWVDQERFVPLKEELYAKSGQLLKKTTLSDVKKMDGRWFPTRINYKDMLKDGKGTDYIIHSIHFDVNIPAHVFTKASLGK